MNRTLPLLPIVAAICIACARSPSAPALDGPGRTVGLKSPATQPAASPAGEVQYVASQPSHVTIKGTSTLHKWTVNGGRIDGKATFSGLGNADALKLHTIELTIPVKSLKSSEGGGMDNTMYNALKEKQQPNITYSLTGAVLKSSPSSDAEPYRFDTTGNLTVAGTARAITLPLEVLQQNGSLAISTEAKLKMTDFGVKPPVAMLGTIRSGDVITVSVTWKLTPKAD